MKFLDNKFERMYNRIKQDGLKDGFTDEDLSSPYLDKLGKQTKSPRIIRMIRLSYTLGWMRGIKHCDEMLNTKIDLH